VFKDKAAWYHANALIGMRVLSGGEGKTFSVAVLGTDGGERGGGLLGGDVDCISPH